MRDLKQDRRAGKVTRRGDWIQTPTNGVTNNNTRQKQHAMRNKTDTDAVDDLNLLATAARRSRITTKTAYN